MDYIPKQIWRGEGRDINWEVVRWMCGDEVVWNTYLYIFDKIMVDKLWTRKKRVYDWGAVYTPKSILENLDWNGGQTYYHQMDDSGKRYIVIGDDYIHSWDKNNTYDEETLIYKIKGIAEQLRQSFKQMEAVK